jgi:hypothetical protein
MFFLSWLGFIKFRFPLRGGKAPAPAGRGPKGAPALSAPRRAVRTRLFGRARLFGRRRLGRLGAWTAPLVG